MDNEGGGRKTKTEEEWKREKVERQNGLRDVEEERKVERWRRRERMEGTMEGQGGVGKDEEGRKVER